MNAAAAMRGARARVRAAPRPGAPRRGPRARAPAHGDPPSGPRGPSSRRSTGSSASPADGEPPRAPACAPRAGPRIPTPCPGYLLLVKAGVLRSLKHLLVLHRLALLCEQAALSLLLGVELGHLGCSGRAFLGVLLRWHPSEVSPRRNCTPVVDCHSERSRINPESSARGGVNKSWLDDKLEGVTI